MHRHLTPRTLGRAQWLSELLQALDEAERLLTLLEAGAGFPDEAARLRQRIQVVRSELDLLNRVVRGEGRVVSSKWPEPASAGAAEA